MNEPENNQLDCLLVSPPIFYEDSENIWKEVNSNFPPLGLASIAAFAREKGYTIKIADCNIIAPSVNSFESFFKENYAKKYSSIKVIGIGAMTCTIKKALKLALICREAYPKAKIVLGGVHPTFLPEEVLQDKNVDMVVMGEGELTFEEILSGKEPSSIKGAAYRDGKKVCINGPRERIMDIDALPMPAYDLLPISEYRPAKGTYKRLPAMSMITSRGCPGQCTYCQKTMGNRIVFKSAEKIFEEISYLVKNYGIKQILFYDDTFTVYPENVSRLCDMIIDSKTDITWTCFARVDYISLPLLQKMKKAGCHQIMYGVESIDPVVLQNIKKNIRPEQVVNAVKWTKKAGIECRLAFMVGNPGDTEQTIEANIKFVSKLNPDLLIVNITTPFPGTPMFAWAKERNLILTYDWDDYSLAKPVLKLETLSVEQIKALYKKMYREFYFRPGFILKKMIGIRSADDIKVLFGGAKSLFSFFGKKKE